MKCIAFASILLFASIAVHAEEQAFDRSLVYAKAVATQIGDHVSIQVYIVNKSSEIIEFQTGSHGGTPGGGTPQGGIILGPDEELQQIPPVRGSAPDVLPTFRFSINEETNQWSAISSGGPTFHTGRPSVFSVEPSQTIKYCGFIVKPERISGDFLGGEINTIPRWGRKARSFRKIMITQFVFVKSDNPNKSMDNDEE